MIKFPNAIGEYNFIDRDNTVYPIGFDKLLLKEIKLMESLKLSEEEYNFLVEKLYYMPIWYFDWLRVYRFKSEEVDISQDKYGHLSIKITGNLVSTIFWEVPILAIVSELYHKEIGDIPDYTYIINNTNKKALALRENCINFSDFGTRRRFSFEVHDIVVSIFKHECRDNFIGTSNVYLAYKHNLTPIGTMSHQVISLIGAIYGYKQANSIVLDMWQEVFNADLGTYLYDTYGMESFKANFSKRDAKLWDGLRVDSGDNYEAINEIIGIYKNMRVDLASKSITFSNGLDYEEAIQIHRYANKRFNDQYGIGTSFVCDCGNGIKPNNIVIKLFAVKKNNNSTWVKCVKLSCDAGKHTGDTDEVDLCKKILNIL
jgi:nicotinate phosphoribosyltransferase